jgi:hypothetical protein
VVLWRAASKGHEENRVDVGGEGGDVLFRGEGGSKLTMRREDAT